VLTAKVQSADWERIVAFLARDSEVPIDEVARLCDNERAKLEASAHITGVRLAAPSYAAGQHRLTVEAVCGSQSEMVAVQRCGSSTSMSLAGWVCRRSSTSSR
jgi:hypothetical protein